MAYGKEDTLLINFSTFKVKAGHKFTVRHCRTYLVKLSHAKLQKNASFIHRTSYIVLICAVLKLCVLTFIQGNKLAWI